MKRQLVAIATTLAVLTITPASAEAAWVRAEAFASPQGVVPDIKGTVNVDIGPVNAAYFFRNRATISYDGTAANFMLHELGIGELYSLRVLMQGIIPGTEVIPRVGLSYHTQLAIDDVTVSLFTAMLSTISSNQSVEWLVAPSCRMPGIGDKKAGLDLEHFLWVNQDAINAAFRTRLGHEVLDGLSVGIGTETDYGQGRKPETAVGAYVRFEK